MRINLCSLGFWLVLAIFATFGASAEEVNLKLHQFLPSQSAIPKNFLKPWSEKVEKESQGKIKISHYPSMQLGGAPPSLIKQVKDGTVELIWTVLGYTPGLFKKSEAFELPFMVTNAEKTSKAFQEYFESELTDEFKNYKVIAVHTHGPGIIHANKPVKSLMDFKGLKLRGPTRVITKMLGLLGATPIGMPVPKVPESLSKKVIDGAVIPWEVSVPLKIADLVPYHTEVSGDRGLYSATFVFAMNKRAYEKLSPDLKKVIDENSGIEAAAWAGRVMDQADIVGRKIAVDKGNDITTLSEEETARWRKAAEASVKDWISEMDEKGYDGKALVDKAEYLLEKHSN